jgi:(1->4)-alpha-D-glucan 1-alpha-D-glucosylmutase
MPDTWNKMLYTWSAANEKYKNADQPDRNTEYFLYQTMIGAWPLSLERLLAYMEKATREAKQRTSWLAPNESYEAATREFIEAIHRDSEFMNSLESFVTPLVKPGWINALAQTLLKFTAPGIPDTYQGEEIWDLSLVDPDNRRPVDYELRRRLLAGMRALDVDQVSQRMDKGLPKLWTIYHALRLRRERERSFGDSGSYTPLQAHGPKARHFVGFRRGEDVLVMVPRLVWQLGNDWDCTTVQVPEGDWLNVLSGERLAAGDHELSTVLRRFPVALIVKSQ